MDLQLQKPTEEQESPPTLLETYFTLMPRTHLEEEQQELEATFSQSQQEELQTGSQHLHLLLQTTLVLQRLTEDSRLLDSNPLKASHSQTASYFLNLELQEPAHLHLQVFRYQQEDLLLQTASLLPGEPYKDQDLRQLPHLELDLISLQAASTSILNHARLLSKQMLRVPSSAERTQLQEEHLQRQET